MKRCIGLDSEPGNPPKSPSPVGNGGREPSSITWRLLESHRINIPRLDNDLPPLNLFLVRELTNRDDKRVKLVKKSDGCFRLREVPSRSNVLATTGGGCCVFEDVIKGGTYLINEAGCLLAHEVGHHRGLEPSRRSPACHVSQNLRRHSAGPIRNREDQHGYAIAA
jgi:hypothetical protein